MIMVRMLLGTHTTTNDYSFLTFFLIEICLKRLNIYTGWGEKKQTNVMYGNSC